MVLGRACLYLLLLTWIPGLPIARCAAMEQKSDAPAASAAYVPAPSPGKLDTFDERKQAMLQAVWQEYQANGNKPMWKNVFLMADALFEMGKVKEARRLANFGLDGLQPGNEINRWITGGNSGFAVWPGIDCYIRYEHLMDEPLKERFKQTYTSGVFYRRFTTSNHVTMAGVTRYLAVQTWGAAAFKPHPAFADQVYEALPPDKKKSTRWPPSQFFANDDPDAVKFVHQFVEHVVRNGPGEYASRPYGAENTLPLLTLAECAKDPEVRLKARIAYEVTLVQLAPPYLRGHLATFAPRSYPDAESQRPWGIAALAWVYFGGVAPNDLAHQWALRAATSKFRLPEVVTKVGTNRSQPFEHRALLSGWNLSHYVTPKYVVYARSPKTALGNKQRYPFQGQSYPCGLMWESDPSLCSHFWVTCPAADDNTSDKNCPSGLHTHGVTSNEQEVMHKNALLWVFHIPKDFRNPYALGFVPGGALAVINDGESAGRIYLHFGAVLIGVTSSDRFKWNPNGGIKAPAGKPQKGASEFRIAAVDSAVAMETASPEELPGSTPAEQLEKFKAALLRKTKINLKPGDKPVGFYTDRAGNTLECMFDGQDKINGKAVDYKNWPILENPWITQIGPDKLTVRDGKTTRTYDFVTWEILENK